MKKVRILFVLFVLVLFPQKSALAVDCPVAGTVPITDRTLAKAAGIPDDQPCWDPKSQAAGSEVGEAKKYLDAMPKRCTKKSSDCQAPPDLNHIIPLNNTFAVCSVRFFKAYIQNYGPLTLSSAYRDGPSGENAAAGGAEGSNHTRGVAIDINPGGGNSSYETLWTFSMKNPQYGICFPHQNGRGGDTTSYPDRPHMVLAGIGGNEAAACARQGIRRPCDGVPFEPQLGGTFVPPAGSFTPVQTPYTPTGFPMIPPYTQPAIPYQSTPISQPSPIIAPPPYTAPTVSTPSVTSPGTQINPNNITFTDQSGKAVQNRNINDVIDTLLGNQKRAPATPTPDILPSTLEKIVRETVSKPVPDSPYLISGEQKIIKPDTFTTQDLKYVPAETAPITRTSFSPLSPVWGLLENMKQALLKALAFLQSFRH